MDATQPLTSLQPGNIVVSGQGTYSVDMAVYQSEIAAIMNQAAPAWQNQANHYDVTRTGLVDPRDRAADHQRNQGRTVRGFGYSGFEQFVDGRQWRWHRR